MKRVIILVLDSVGIGSSKDAIKFKDTGSNTLGHIAENYPLSIPNLTNLGIVKALKASSGSNFGLKDTEDLKASFGYGIEISTGKDTVSGHWEIACSPVLTNFGYFTNLTNSFPEELLKEIINKANLKGFLGNCHASGTEIIKQLGEEHLKTKLPIFYTSADSVFQIATHEEVFGLQNLYKLCELVREILLPYNIGRVIARPFIGINKNNFQRTSNRKDYALKPFSDTIFNVAQKNNIKVVAIGKTADIFSHDGIDFEMHSPYLEGSINDTIKALKEYKQSSLIFTNFSDFDALYGHRRDVNGYAKALEYFDSRLPEILNLITPNDLLIITADHGNDPTWSGTDHTREHIPVLVFNKELEPKNLGVFNTFSDIGQSVLTYLNLPPLKYGKSFL